MKSLFLLYLSLTLTSSLPALSANEIPLQNIVEWKDPFLFRRQREIDCFQHDWCYSKKVLAILHSFGGHAVYFDTKPPLFNGRGVCSAMALDFLARYLDECSEETSRRRLRKKIKNYAKYYSASNSTFASRQAAFNAILVDRKAFFADPEAIKYEKIQALANFHSIVLKPATPTIQLSEIIESPAAFDALIDILPSGCYLLRMLIPEDNGKMEKTGHTTILAKGEKFSLFYDNAYGAFEITTDVARCVREELLMWKLSEVRIYSAGTGATPLVNFSEEKYPTSQQLQRLRSLQKGDCFDVRGLRKHVKGIEPRECVTAFQ